MVSVLFYLIFGIFMGYGTSLNANRWQPLKRYADAQFPPEMKVPARSKYLRKFFVKCFAFAGASLFWAILGLFRGEALISVFLLVGFILGIFDFGEMGLKALGTDRDEFIQKMKEEGAIVS